MVRNEIESTKEEAVVMGRSGIEAGRGWERLGEGARTCGGALKAVHEGFRLGSGGIRTTEGA